MRIPQIQITTTDIKMDYQQQNAQIQIHSGNAQVSLKQPAAIIDIQTTPGKLQIDASQARRDLGLIGAFESVKNYAAKGKQLAMQGITRRVQEGRQLMLNAGKGQGAEPIKNIAAQNHGPKRAGPINIRFVPSIGSVKIHYTPGKVQINNRAQAVKTNVQMNPLNIDYKAGSITGTMIQRPDVHIDVKS